MNLFWGIGKVLLVEKETWTAPTVGEEKLIALEGKVKTLEKFKKQSSAAPKGQGQGKKEFGKNTPRPKPKHLKTAPKTMAEAKKVHKWNNKDWNWCGSMTGGKCEAWRCHKASECKGTARKAKKPDRKHPKPEGSKSKKEPKLKLAEALSALLAQQEDEEDEPQYE